MESVIVNKKSVVQKLTLIVAVIATAYTACNWGPVVSLITGCAILFLLEPAILKLFKLYKR